MNGVDVPSLQDLLPQTGGTALQFPDQGKWAEVASKTNMITSSASPALVEKLAGNLDAVRKKQLALAEVLGSACIQAVHIGFPEADMALKHVLLCYELGDKDPESPWFTIASHLQKVSEMNLSLVMGFDVQGVLGADIGKAFSSQMQEMQMLFQASSFAADWWTPV